MRIFAYGKFGYFITKNKKDRTSVSFIYLFNPHHIIIILYEYKDLNTLSNNAFKTQNAYLLFVCALEMK